MMRPLRIAALAILAVGAVASLLLLVVPWLPSSDVTYDLYYAVAKARQELPLAAGAAVIGLLVVQALRATRSRGRWASAGLWLILFGAAGLLAFIAVQIGFDLQPKPRRHEELVHGHLPQLRLQTQFMLLASLAIIVGLVGGMLLWVLAYRLDRPRPR